MGFHFVVSIIFFEQQSYNYLLTKKLSNLSCCWYHKGTNFQANHNNGQASYKDVLVVADTTKVRIFKQITTTTRRNSSDILLLLIPQRYEFSSKSQPGMRYVYDRNCCCWYHKGTNFQANHNKREVTVARSSVVADTTKVRIFKQITTTLCNIYDKFCCCWYHKGTNFQANHN